VNRSSSGQKRRNLDRRTAEGFDQIWRSYGPADGSDADRQAFESFFSIFPLERLKGAEGFDLGCGNGRIARSVAPLAGFLHCIDQSAAGLTAAKQSMRKYENVDFLEASVDAIPIPDASQDFGYSLGVLHHVPDPAAGLRSCVGKLKRGAPFLLYLYYSLDNRPHWFRLVWRASDVTRRGVSRLPFKLRVAASTLLAATIYWPLSRMARALGAFGIVPRHFPLSTYANRSWATLKADSLDRFGTSIEHRFSKVEIKEMMEDAGLTSVRFAESAPYWIALGYKD
jgi:ubiquinone/menaquinone biosynthesis C-methylase UbiE